MAHSPQNGRDVSNEQPLKNDPLDDKHRLSELIKRALAKEAVKEFSSAVELYSLAAELQAKLNGEMAVENADLLFLYGKSLYNLAISNSDVFGSKMSTDIKGAHQEYCGSKIDHGNMISSKGIVPETAHELDEARPVENESIESQPCFQFLGDENSDTDSEDDEGPDDGKDAESVGNELANAYEVLDLARILLKKKLDLISQGPYNEGESKHIQRRLADTYDLQAEISLEGERFADAVADLQVSLDLKAGVLSFDDPSMAECHYKLSLALEFNSIACQPKEIDNRKICESEALRKQAEIHMERAIQSCKLRFSNERATSNSSTHNQRTSIEKHKSSDLEDIILDMEQRVSSVVCIFIVLFRANDILQLSELQQPLTRGRLVDENKALKSIINEAFGTTITGNTSAFEEVKRNANDLSKLVKRKMTGPENAGNPIEEELTLPSSSSLSKKQKLNNDSDP